MTSHSLSSKKLGTIGLKTAFLLRTVFLIALALSTFNIERAFAAKFKAVTSFTIIADMARNIAGDAAIVESITKPGTEIHEYQPTPQDLMRASGANLILWNGLNLETWFAKFFDNLETIPPRNIANVIISKGVAPMSINNGPYNGKPNPHAWMSPKMAMIYIDNIRDAFMQYDPENAVIYRENAKNYKAKLQAVIAPLALEFEKLPKHKRYLVTSEGAFSYLARDYGLKELFLWPINADQQGTPKQIKSVIDAMHQQHIPVIFSESTISDAPAKQVARETGAEYGGVLYVDSLSDKNGPVPTYLDLLKVTSTTILQGLQNAKVTSKEKKNAE